MTNYPEFDSFGLRDYLRAVLFIVTLIGAGACSYDFYTSQRSRIRFENPETERQYHILRSCVTFYATSTGREYNLARFLELLDREIDYDKDGKITWDEANAEKNMFVNKIRTTIPRIPQSKAHEASALEIELLGTDPTK